MSPNQVQSPTIEVQGATEQPLGMPPAQFLRDYWQKRPLLIRAALPGFESPLSPEDLAGLACEDGVLARIVARERSVHGEGRDKWTLRHGPFPEALFPTLPDHDWTLLVQDVDKWDADIRAVLDRFDFLPRWRIDDVMVSFAAPGGSVGAHVDQYDVFLLQAQGHRRWRIDTQDDPPLHFRLDSDLRLLQRFSPDQDWVLGPGDMLYLPPGVPHHGEAEDACLTFSIGMRAPGVAELLGDFVDNLAAETDESARYRDPDLSPPEDANEIDTHAMARATAALETLRTRDPEQLGDWFGRFITLYRSAGEAMPPDDARARIEIEWDLQRGATLLRHPWTRMAWRRSGKGARLYAAGRDFDLPLRDAQRLAASNSLAGDTYVALGDAGRDAVFALYEDGHYQLQLADEDA